MFKYDVILFWLNVVFYTLPIGVLGDDLGGASVVLLFVYLSFQIISGLYDRLYLDSRLAIKNPNNLLSRIYSGAVIGNRMMFFVTVSLLIIDSPANVSEESAMVQLAPGFIVASIAAFSLAGFVFSYMPENMRRWFLMNVNEKI